MLRWQVVSADGDHGTGWFDVQRLPEELWAGAPPKRMPLRRLAEVYSEQEAVPLMKQELLKASDPVRHGDFCRAASQLTHTSRCCVADAVGGNLSCLSAQHI